MDFLLNVAIWALLLVHVDSTLGKDLPSVDHPVLPDSGETPEPPATVLNATQSNTNGSTQNAAVPTVVGLSTTIPPKEETNTGNAAPTESTVHVSIIPSTGTTSSSTASSSTASSSTASTSAASTTPSSVPPTAVHLNPSQTLSPTQSPGTPATNSARPDSNHTTTTASHHTESTRALPASTGADLHHSIKPTGETSTQQHREPSAAHPDIPTATSRAAHLVPTATPLGTSSAPANARADTPSQLSMGGGATAVHETAAVDPLIAGLVSAFIITAVIITLLLFLKLRRRDNRPEFRRLQDLPMDDMMEDTPLSMYSY